ncbi:MAG TPA: homoserine kinase [Elusimicrobia bacterium]|nr:homoserine kinase [Elusimicrobiota bacterium]
MSLKLVNQIPLARGLGSSAAARIGGLVAANKICEVITSRKGTSSPVEGRGSQRGLFVQRDSSSGNKLSDNEILSIAAQLEGHPDNVVPAFFGGLCISLLDKREINYVKLEFSKDLIVVVCIPELTISTEKARKILPKRVPLKDAVFNSSRVALLISALKEKRYDLLKLAMEDRLHQPYREKLIPGFKRILENAYRTGALGVALSGSGSTILAISDKRSAVSEKIGQAMVETFKKEGIKSRYLVLGIDQEGVKVEKKPCNV